MGLYCVLNLMFDCMTVLSVSLYISKVLYLYVNCKLMKILYVCRN